MAVPTIEFKQQYVLDDKSGSFQKASEVLTNDSHRTVSDFIHCSFHNKDVSIIGGLESLYPILCIKELFVYL